MKYLLTIALSVMCSSCATQHGLTLKKFDGETVSFNIAAGIDVHMHTQ